MKFKYTILFWHLKFNFNKLQHTLKLEQKEGPILQGLLPFSTIVKSNKIYRKYNQKRIEKLFFFCLLPGLFIFEENVNIFLRYKNPNIFSINACYKKVKFLEKTFLITLFNVSCRPEMSPPYDVIRGGVVCFVMIVIDFVEFVSKIYPSWHFWTFKVLFWNSVKESFLKTWYIFSSRV